MNWNVILAFARGPFFQVALLVFIAGMVYRLVRVLLLGWKPRPGARQRQQSWAVSSISYLKGHR